MINMLFWVAVGIVVAKLVPMPWLDEPVRNAWAKVWGWVSK